MVGVLAEPPRVGEFAGGRIDRPFVPSRDGRIVPAADGVDHGGGNAVLAGHASVRPPFELGFPAGPDGDDGQLRQAALDRCLEPQDLAQRGEVPPDVRRMDEGVEGAGQGTLVGHDAVPYLLATGCQFVAAQVRKTAHGSTIVRAARAAVRAPPNLGRSGDSAWPAAWSR